MTNPAQRSTFILRSSLRELAIAVALLFAFSVVLMPSAQAQTFTVLHNFTGGADGAYPYAGLTMDRVGNLYGTTTGRGNGSVYKLKRSNGGWTLVPLYNFAVGNGGTNPYAGVTFGPDGSLYGTTQYGGSGHGDGTVFKLTPPPRVSPNLLAPWTETVLYSFQAGSDGNQPYGGVTFDQAGNIYGTTGYGGQGCFGEGCGTVYRLTPSGSGWTESVIYAFSGSDGLMPFSGVTLDNVGNVYGTTLMGGVSGYGTLYELTYSAGTGWAESFLYSFNSAFGDLGFPYAGLTFDTSGDLYGAAADECGGVFGLTPSNGTWTYSVLDNCPVDHPRVPPPGSACGPRGNLVMDGEGNLYGTTYCDGAYSQGSVFKLVHINGGWSFMSVYNFTGLSDGEWPSSNVVFDVNGNLYGTTSQGGAYGYGVVWEITP